MTWPVWNTAVKSKKEFCNIVLINLFIRKRIVAEGRRKIVFWREFYNALDWTPTREGAAKAASVHNFSSKLYLLWLIAWSLRCVVGLYDPIIANFATLIKIYYLALWFTICSFWGKTLRENYSQKSIVRKTKPGHFC